MSTVYAAVIEWPDTLGFPPSLILKADEAQLLPAVKAELMGEAERLDGEAWAALPFRDFDRLHTLQMALLNAAGEPPFVTTYTEEVRL
ncbi:hypothetical protein [Microbacterium sp.]|uniref:hypothetical protein n=1 Tax=Microbacterium sp. TaxID=51671 RepID=UPI0039E3B2B9